MFYSNFSIWRIQVPLAYMKMSHCDKRKEKRNKIPKVSFVPLFTGLKENKLNE